MLSLNATITSIINSLTSKPVEIHDIYLGSQTSEDSNTLHFVSFYKSVNFFQYISNDPQAYTSLGIQRAAIKRTAKGEIDRVGYKLDNVNKAMGAYAASHDFRNKRIVTRLIFRDALDSYQNTKVIFDGFIQSIMFERSSMTATCVPIINSLSFETGWPYQIKCNAKFGDTFCGVNKESAENRVTGTATGGTTSTLIDTVNLTQIDDYWNIGMIEFTSGNNTGSKRKIIDFISSTDTLYFDYLLDNTVASGDGYIVTRGCDKRLTTCQNTYNNDINYHGFHTIPLTK